MDFNKVRRIKKCVSRINQFRGDCQRPILYTSIMMFSIGNWSVDIFIPADGCLYSSECLLIFPLLDELGCTFFIGTKGGIAKICIQ